MPEVISIEALAHYTRGLSTMFFIIWFLNIYHYRHHSRMMQVKYLAVCVITIGFVKDMIFLFPSFMRDKFVENIVVLADLMCTPFVCAFFFETSRPGIVTSGRLLSAASLFFVFIPLYAVIRDEMVLDVAFTVSLIVSVLSFILVIRNVLRYNKSVVCNYSYTQNLTVSWVAFSAALFNSWFILYYFCFRDATWEGEVFYDLYSIVMWTIIWVYSRRHRVIAEMARQEASGSNLLAEEAEQDAPMQDNEEDGAESNASAVAKEEFFTLALCQKMEVEKVFLDPRLSLSDLAQAVGTNRSYLSEYINKSGRTFYDYVNNYRIAEACSIIEEEPKASMGDVASRSGFNSISSFNRYFFKAKGMSPTAYRKSFQMAQVSHEE